MSAKNVAAKLQQESAVEAYQLRQRSGSVNYRQQRTCTKYLQGNKKSSSLTSIEDSLRPVTGTIQQLEKLSKDLAQDTFEAARLKYQQLQKQQQSNVLPDSTTPTTAYVTEHPKHFQQLFTPLN